MESSNSFKRSKMFVVWINIIFRAQNRLKTSAAHLASSNINKSDYFVRTCVRACVCTFHRHQDEEAFFAFHIYFNVAIFSVKIIIMNQSTLFEYQAWARKKTILQKFIFWCWFFCFEVILSGTNEMLFRIHFFLSLCVFLLLVYSARINLFFQQYSWLNA